MPIEPLCLRCLRSTVSDWRSMEETSWVQGFHTFLTALWKMNELFIDFCLKYVFKSKWALVSSLFLFLKVVHFIFWAGVLTGYRWSQHRTDSPVDCVFCLSWLLLALQPPRRVSSAHVGQKTLHGVLPHEWWGLLTLFKNFYTSQLCLQRMHSIGIVWARSRVPFPFLLLLKTPEEEQCQFRFHNMWRIAS